MTDTASFVMGLSVDGGPSIAGNEEFEVEAYEKIEVVVPKSSVPTTVNVQPSGAGMVKGLIIISDRYASLTYTVDEVVTVQTLDKPLMLVGAGALALLGGVPNDLIFTNASTTVDANVTILVVRDAIEA